MKANKCMTRPSGYTCHFYSPKGVLFILHIELWSVVKMVKNSLSQRRVGEVFAFLRIFVYRKYLKKAKRKSFGEREAFLFILSLNSFSSFAPTPLLFATKQPLLLVFTSIWRNHKLCNAPNTLTHTHTHTHKQPYIQIKP